MTQSVFINAGSVSTAGGSLLRSAAKASTAGTGASAALSDTGGLPPAYRGRASALAGQMRRCHYASDAFVAVGLELQSRAGIAAQEDGKRLGFRSILGTPGSLATSKKINFWNEQTRAAARAKPGRFFNDVNKILGLTNKKSAPKAPGGKCEKVWKTESKAIADAGAKTKLGEKHTKAYEDKLKMLVHQYKKAGRPIPSMGPQEMKIFVGLMAQAMAGGSCSVSLGKGVEAKAMAVAKAVAKAGGDVAISKRFVRGEVVLDLSIKGEVNGSVSKDGTRATGSAAGLLGLKAILKGDVGFKDYKLKAGARAGLAVGLGAEGSMSVEINLKGLLAEEKPPPRAVGSRGPHGILKVTSAQ